MSETGKTMAMQRPIITLRTRFAIASGLLVLVVIGMVGISAYAVTSSELRRQVDASLDSRMTQVVERIGRRPGGGLNVRQRDDDFFSDRDAVTQIVFPDRTVAYVGNTTLPVTGGDDTLLESGQGVVRDTISVDGVTYRTLSRVLPSGALLKIGLNTEDAENAGDAIRTWFILIGAVGFATAAGLGWVFAGRTTRPIARLAATTGQIAVTQDLEHSIDLGNEAEVRGLAENFNTMLAALRNSRQRQQQLVQDASHELRTPLTSLRANTELLQRDGLSAVERASILGDMRAEIDELAELSSELSALATDQRAAETPQPVDLAEVASEVAARAQRRTTGAVTVEATGDSVVVARPQQLERAVSNLVDNAIKFGPQGSDVTIRVADRRVEVHDRGPGIADEDKPFVFDRFYRAIGSRSLPGSGLGLSIVSQFADDNGATTFVRDADGGGVVVGLDFGARSDG